MEVWKEQNEEYLYFVEAEVLTGKSTPGKPGLILPPAVGTDPQILYDSVSGGTDISVIFSSYQALPMYIITCKVVWRIISPLFPLGLLCSITNVRMFQ